jgi:beta-lactamase regulating signal transducer with metallopeptidase domain
LARRFFGARLAYVLWALPLFAAAMCFAPPRTEHVVLDAPLGVAAALSSPPPLDHEPNVLPFVLWAWAGGALLSLIILALRQFRFLRALGRLHARDDLGARVLAAESTTHGPAIIGVVRPVIVTPADFDARFDAEERRIILAHERAHVAQGDPWVNAIVLLVQCLSWFNPLVHIGARALRIDQELACDAAVLEQTEGVRRRYAETMLKTQLAAAVPIGCAWPPSSLAALKERISMLKRSLPSRKQTLIGAFALGLVAVVACAAAWAAQPARVVATYAHKTTADASSDSYTPVSYTINGAMAGDPGNDADADPDLNIDLENAHFDSGRRWSDLTPEEQQEVRDSLEEARQQMRDAREQVRQAIREAQESGESREEALQRAREAAEEARQQMEETRAEREQALQEARQSLDETRAEREQALAEAQQALEETRAEREQALREAQAEVARAQVALAQMPDVEAALQQASEEVEREAVRQRARGNDAEADDLERAARSMRSRQGPNIDLHRRERLHGQEMRKHGIR